MPLMAIEKAMSIDIDDERNTDMGKKQFNT